MSPESRMRKGGHQQHHTGILKGAPDCVAAYHMADLMRQYRYDLILSVANS